MRLRLGPGYAGGTLLQRLRQEFSDFEFSAAAPDAGEFSSGCGAVRFQIRERVESHFLLQIANAEFICRCRRIPAGDDPISEGTLSVMHRGMLRRTGIEYGEGGAGPPAAARLKSVLAASAELTAALLPLDFTRCRVQFGPQGVEMRLNHYGACEIVGQLPRFRRYIRLGRQQRECMLKAFDAFRRLIEAPPP